MGTKISFPDILQMGIKIWIRLKLHLCSAGKQALREKWFQCSDLSAIPF